MNESPDTTGCDGMAVRPIIRMHAADQAKNASVGRRIRYGNLTAAFSTGNVVELWFQSPTGDQSDSVIFHLPCKTADQAEQIAAAHRDVWHIPKYC